MTTAAERPQHLHVVPDPPADPTPLEGVVVKAPPAAPGVLVRAGQHVTTHRGYIPLVLRGYRRIGAAWADRYHGDWPLLIDTIRREYIGASVERQEALKAFEGKRRRAYLLHRATYAGQTGCWALAGGTGIAAGTAAGGAWVTLAASAIAWGYGIWRGAGEEPAPIAPALGQPLAAGVPASIDPNLPEGEAALIAALVKADIITAAQAAETKVVGGIRRDGPGWAARIELPEGMPADKATSKLTNLAGALRVKASQIEFKPDTAEDAHEGMVTLWVGDHVNPFAGPKVHSQLLNAPSWRFWQDGVPLGEDARQARQTLNLIWSSILIGGLQDYGKSYLARLIAAAAALDPTVRIIVITGKKGPDWAPLKKIAHRYIAGSDPDTIREIFSTMTTVINDMQDRGEELDRLFEDEPHRVPEGKITPELAENGMGPVIVIVEELQELLGGAAVTKMPAPDDDSEKPRLVSAKPHLVELFARFNRAARFVLGMGVYITQRPDADSVPTELREVCVKRVCFRTKTRVSSEMVLGEDAVKAGASPHALLESSKGVFVLEEGAEDGYRTMRGDVIDLPQFAEICERGRQLRIEAGTLTGDAARREEQAQLVAKYRALIVLCLRVMDDLDRDAAQLDELAAAAGVEADGLADGLRAAGVVRPEKVVIAGKRIRGYDRACLEAAMKGLR